MLQLRWDWEVEVPELKTNVFVLPVVDEFQTKNGQERVVVLNSVARRVADSLQLELYDDSKLQQIALKIGMHADDLKSLDEKAPGFFDRMLSKRSELYLDYMPGPLPELLLAASLLKVPLKENQNQEDQKNNPSFQG